MNGLTGPELRPVLGQQLDWFLRAIAIAAWRWHLPFDFDSEEVTAQAQEECHILINALTYGVLVPALVNPMEIDFNKVFATFFTNSKIGEMTSLDLAEALARALNDGLED